MEIELFPIELFENCLHFQLTGPGVNLQFYSDYTKTSLVLKLQSIYIIGRATLHISVL